MEFVDSGFVGRCHELVLCQFHLPEPKNWILNLPFPLDFDKDEKEILKHVDTTKNDTIFVVITFWEVALVKVVNVALRATHVI